MVMMPCRVHILAVIFYRSNRDTLKEHKAVYHVLHGQNCLIKLPLIEAGNVVKLVPGNMEFGPRALGNRSIWQITEPGDAKTI